MYILAAIKQLETGFVLNKMMLKKNRKNILHDKNNFT